MTTSAFGVEHSDLISKRKNSDETNSAVVGAGGTAAGLGFIGGGIPGAKAKKLSIDVADAKWYRKPGVYAKSKQAGIFGYRENAHRTLRDLNDGMNPNNVKQKGSMNSYHTGRIAGARAAETKIIRHMHTGKVASNALLIGGLGTAAYGLSNKALDKRRKRTVVKKADTKDKRDAALAGGGAFTGTAALGLGRITGKESQKWLGEANTGLNDAQRIVPGLGGAKVKTNRNGSLRSVRPEIKHEDVKASHLKGASPAAVKEAGRLRGRAIQAGYFGHVYGAHSRLMNRVVAPAALGVGALGASGLYSRHKKRS